jgi:hypothetical protein
MIYFDFRAVRNNPTFKIDSDGVVPVTFISLFIEEPIVESYETQSHNQTSYFDKGHKDFRAPVAA